MIIKNNGGIDFTQNPKKDSGLSTPLINVKFNAHNDITLI